MDHGGDLTTALAHYGFAAEDWIDLSTGINPYAYPHDDIPSAALRRLPSRDDLHKLLITARSAYGVPDGAAIMAAPGTQAIIQTLPNLFAPKPTQIVTPTYSEHEDAWRAAGHIIIRSDKPDPENATFMILGNPNNPDCRVWDVDELLKYASLFSQKGGLLVVDEAFADAVPEVSAVSGTDQPGILILRSFGKFYGLAGTRLGFAIGEQAVIRQLQAAMGPWPVSGPAIYLGMKALADEKWKAQTRKRLVVAMDDLKEVLRSAGLQVETQTSLYVIVKAPDSAALHDHLARRAIWTRYFPYNKHWLRIGLPESEAKLARLGRALVGAPVEGAVAEE